MEKWQIKINTKIKIIKSIFLNEIFFLEIRREKNITQTITPKNTSKNLSAKIHIIPAPKNNIESIFS
jgi:hypothetical protein